MRNPKILHISTPTSWRGGEQQLAYLAEELFKKDIDQHILCAKDGEMAKRCKSQNWPCTEVKERFSVNPLFAKAVKHVCRKEKIDIIHVHDSHAHTFAVMAASFFGNDCPIIVSRRVDFSVSKSPLSKWKYNHPMVRAILCVSDMIKEITAPSIRDKSLLKTVYSGVDKSRYEKRKVSHPLIEKLGLNPDKPIIGNVAALADHKDYPTFIETAKEIISRSIDAQFVIVGDGPLKSEVEELVNNSGIADHIFMTGFQKDVLEIISDFDIFLITSKTEGLGTSILDAFGCEIPVVATEAGGIPEIVQNEKTGLTAPVKSPEKLADQIERYLKDESLKKEMIEGATKLLENFTKEATAQKTLEVYRSLLEK